MHACSNSTPGCHSSCYSDSGATAKREVMNQEPCHVSHTATRSSAPSLMLTAPCMLCCVMLCCAGHAHVHGSRGAGEQAVRWQDSRHMELWRGAVHYAGRALPLPGMLALSASAQHSQHGTATLNVWGEWHMQRMACSSPCRAAAQVMVTAICDSNGCPHQLLFKAVHCQCFANAWSLVALYLCQPLPTCC